jgi:pyruvate formate lyase activating enzyme
MEIHGFNKTTLLDYPEHIAATVFTGGCNFRCPFCHNGELVLDPVGQPSVAEEEVLSYLKKRQGILQGVCVTGGEPTLQRDLRKFLQKIKELEYPIKLDTNGYMPGVLWELLQEHLIDYVAMDIKASKDNYARAAGLPYIDISRIEESIGILKSSGIPYEFRTTVVKGIHTVGEFEEIGRWIEGCPAYYLQNYQENDNCLYRMIQTAESNAVKPGGAEVFGAFSREELEQMAELARKHVGKVVLRGVVGT